MYVCIFVVDLAEECETHGHLLTIEGKVMCVCAHMCMYVCIFVVDLAEECEAHGHLLTIEGKVMCVCAHMCVYVCMYFCRGYG